MAQFHMPISKFGFSNSMTHPTAHRWKPFSLSVTSPTSAQGATPSNHQHCLQQLFYQDIVQHKHLYSIRKNNKLGYKDYR